MTKVKCYKWKDSTGYVHIVPDGACPICKNCSDIFLDPFLSNQIYACVCGLKNHESSELSRNCCDFEIDEDVGEDIWKEGD